MNPQFSFNELIRAVGCNESDVIVARNKPLEKKLNSLLPGIICERPDLFRVYQSCQGKKLEGAMKKAKYLVSCLGREAGSAHFVKFFEIKEHRPLSHKEFWEVPEHIELRKNGYEGFTEEGALKDKYQLQFDLQEIDALNKRTGRLVLNWPPPEISWWRYASRNEFSVKAILMENFFKTEMPVWNELVVNWLELQILPSSWRQKISQWRGVYLIRDSSDGKYYVGSAYGSENILGRWKHYEKSGHGGNKHLKKRDPQNFAFSILQILAHDTHIDDVIAVENTWKNRLQTIFPDGLNAN